MMNVNLMVDQVPPTRTYPCSHICRNGTALTWSNLVLFYRYHQRGKVMCASYPDRVDNDNLVCPGYVICRRSRLGQFSLATTVAGVRSDTGATDTSPTYL